MAKKKKVIAGTAAAVAVAGAIAGGIMISPTTPSETGHYTIVEKSKYVSQMEVDVADKYDLAELYLGDYLIDRAMLPTDKFEATPVMFKGLENYKIKLYTKGRQSAEGVFLKNGTIELKEADGE